jgi:ribosome-associated protein
MRACLIQELQFRTSRSSGPGGQHVNKTETRVELVWSLSGSICLNENQKATLRSRLGRRITEGGLLVMASEKYRSQHRNKAEVTERFLDLVQASLIPVKKRRPTAPTRSSVEQRIKNKKIRGELKRSRRNPGDP